MLNWNKKERPLPSLIGLGGGAGGFAFGGGSDAGTYTIYLWGAGASQNPGKSANVKAGFTELTIERSSIPGTYSRFEVIVGQEGNTSQSTGARYGGGAGGAPQGGKPGGGGSFVFLSSPGSTNVFTSSGTALGVPVPQADSRCVGAAGGMGGEDTGDNGPATPGGGLTIAPGGGYSPETPTVDRSNGSPGYIGQTGAPGSPWHSGGGGGGFAGGMSHYDYPGWGGSGFAGSNNPAQSQPFTGPSPVNSLVYTLGTTIGNNPTTTAWTAPSGAAPYRPSQAGGPSQLSPVDDVRGYVVIIDDRTGAATQFGYTGGVQFYNFS